MESIKIYDYYMWTIHMNHYSLYFINYTLILSNAYMMIMYDRQLVIIKSKLIKLLIYITMHGMLTSENDNYK